MNRSKIIKKLANTKWSALSDGQLMDVYSLLSTDHWDIAVEGLLALDEHIAAGAKLVKQDGEFHLFSTDGNGIASGEVMIDLLIDLAHSTA